MSSQNQKQRFVWIALSAGILALLLWGALSGERQWNWVLDYDTTSKEPYGAGILRTLMPGYVEGTVEDLQEPLSKALLPDSGAYFFLGRKPRYQAGELDTLLAWVQAGHTAFVAASSWIDSLPLLLGANSVDADVWASHPAQQLLVQFSDSAMAMPDAHRLHRRIRDRRPTVDWYLMDTAFSFWSFPAARGLCFAPQGCLFFRIQAGAGFFYFLTTPLALTNRPLSEPEGRDFAERLLSFLPPGDLLWDSGFRPQLGGPPPPNVSPLRFVLQQAPLRQAWYLLLIMALLFLLFRTRRRQAPIPLLNPKVNRSLRFVEHVADLHLAQGNDHSDIQAMLREQGRDFIRSRFQINLQDAGRETPEKLAQRLAHRSGISLSEAEALLQDLAPGPAEREQELAQAEATQPVGQGAAMAPSKRVLQAASSKDKKTLLTLHRRLQHFYEHCATP